MHDATQGSVTGVTDSLGTCQACTGDDAGRKGRDLTVTCQCAQSPASSRPSQELGEALSPKRSGTSRGGSSSLPSGSRRSDLLPLTEGQQQSEVGRGQRRQKHDRRSREKSSLGCAAALAPRLHALEH